MTSKVCVLRMEGTNCEEEAKTAFERAGLEAELVHLKQLTGECPQELTRDLLDYQILILPGGWSAGDHVRAGAIFAARIKSKLITELKTFSERGSAIVGICNGFQILLELGMLPGWGEDDVSKEPVAALIPNLPGKFQCRASFLKHENSCTLTKDIPVGKILQFPVAHAEGRLTFGGGEKDRKGLKRLLDNKQIIFRYCQADGQEANGRFPENPNGSLYDIAGISNRSGNILGLMPHPERVIRTIQEANWTRKDCGGKAGSGRIFFESLVNYVKRA